MKRLADDADGQRAEFASNSRDDGRSARPCAAAHSGSDEHHMRAGDMRANFFDRFFRRSFTDFRPRTGTEPFRQVDAELDAVFGA